MKWIAEGTWQATSALHCGGERAGELSGVDMRIARDAAGRYFIPGASLAGAARSYVARRLMEPAEFETSDQGDRAPTTEPPAIRKLFGARMEYASLFSAADGALEGTATFGLRDGVRIDPANGLAYDEGKGGAKYDLEVLPAGTRFQLRFELRTRDEPEAVKIFGLLLEGFRDGSIRLGARTRRGYGSGRVETWSIRHVESPADYVAWLKRDPNAGKAVKLEDLGAPVEDRRKFLEIELWLRLKTSLLVRSGGHRPRDPDALHLTESGKAVLPGTSLAGVLRHRCLRIARTLRPADGCKLVDGMFGPHTDDDKREALKASRVWVDEADVHDAKAHVHTRVAIDRFTQAALESKLFEEAPMWPVESVEGHIQGLRLRLEAPRATEESTFEWEAALLLMAVKDLWLGDITVGGGAGVGRGVFNGVRAIFRSHAFDGPIGIAAVPGKRSIVEKSGGESDWQLVEEWCSGWAGAGRD